MGKGLSKKGARDKGLRFQARIAKELRVHWPDARSNSQYRSGEYDGCDVERTPFFIECKAHTRVNIKAALRQALQDSDGRPAVAITKDDNGPTLVTMYFDDWLELAGAESEDYSETWETGDEF